MAKSGSFDQPGAITRKTSAALVSVGSNVTLVVLKLIVGLVSGSVSILSEAIHSANDLVAALVAFFSVRVSDRPPDHKHPYGHGKIESISGVFEALLILVAALWIIYEAVRKIISGSEVEHLGLGTGVMLFSVLLNALVSRYLFKVGREEDSLALEADAQHLATDVYTSLGVAVGLVLVWITDWHIIDPLVAIAVAILIGSISVRLTLRAGEHLLDISLPASDIAAIEEIVGTDSRIHSFHQLRTRKSGSQRHIDLHIVLDPETTLRVSHEIADEIERRLAEKFSPAYVVIHVDPYDPAREVRT